MSDPVSEAHADSEELAGRLILVAHGNSGRGRRIAAAGRSAGHPTAMVSDGATAIEIALSKSPTLVISETDLPLVNGPKLADILRANPHTQTIRFIFLGDSALGDQAGGAGKVGEVYLPITATEAAVMDTVEEVIRKQGRIEDLDAATDVGHAEGQLEQLPLADLLALFHLNQKSGQLDLVRSGDDLAVPGVSGDRGSILIRDGVILQAETDSVEGEKALFRLLAWRNGRFNFEPGRTDAPPKILAPTRALLSEGLRQLAEWDRLAPQLPPLDSQVKLSVNSSQLPSIVHPLTQEVLLLLEHYPRVGDVVDRCSFPDYQVLRTLHTLAERELVQVAQAPVAPLAPVTRVEGLFDESQVRRLRDFLEAVSIRGGRTVRGKLLVVASEPTAVSEFARLLSEVPGVELAPSIAEQELSATVITPIERIRSDDEIQIDLVHVSAQERFAPLWSFAGHGALGSLFLLSGPVSQASEQLEAVTGMLGKLPRQRTLHVMMLPKGERISPDELRDGLSLIDEASLFLLPLESSKEPAALLRSLFARVVP
jgi:CheY-like chemotaxis protein